MDRFLGHIGQCAAAWAVFLCAVAWTVFYLAAWASVRLHGPSSFRGCMDRLLAAGKLSDCMGRLSLCGSLDRLLSVSAVAWTVFLAAWANVRQHGPSCFVRLHGPSFIWLHGPGAAAWAVFIARLHGPSLLLLCAAAWTVFIAAAAWAVFIDYHAAALADFIMTMNARRCTHPEVATLTTKPSHAVS